MLEGINYHHTKIPDQYHKKQKSNFKTLATLATKSKDLESCEKNYELWKSFQSKTNYAN